MRRKSGTLSRVGQILPWMAITVAVVVPSSRELLVLNARLLAGIPLNGTYVRGQPPGCTVRHVPNVQFTDARLADLARRAATDPDAYLLARMLHLPDATVPPPPAWRGHPLVVWAAVELARDTHLHPRARRRTRELVEVALSDSPDAAALWCSTALVADASVDPNGTRGALMQATTCPTWGLDLTLVARELEARLVTAGYPRFDALEARLSAGRGLVSDVRRLLVRRAAEVVGDERALARAVGLAREVARLDRLIPSAQGHFGGVLLSDETLADAIAEHGGIEVCQSRLWPTESDRIAVVLERLERSADPALVADLRASEQTWRAERALLNAQRRTESDLLMRHWLLAAGIGRISLFVFVPVILLFLGELATAAPAGSRRGPNWLGLLTSACLLALLAWISYILLHAVNQPVGLRSGEPRSPLPYNLAGAAVVAIVVVAATRSTHREIRKGRRLLFQVLVVVLAAAALVGGWAREQAIAMADSMTAG